MRQQLQQHYQRQPCWTRLQRRSRQLCRQAGCFSPLGLIRTVRFAQLRQPFLFSVTIRGSSRCRRKWRRAIWSTVSAAVIGRAAQQLCQLTLTKRLVRPPPQTATLGRRLRPCQRGWTDMTPGYNPSVICNPAALRGKMGSPRSNVQFR